MIREIGDYLADMLAYAEKAKSFVGSMSVAEFQLRFPSIPWRKIVGMRNILVHNYDGADPDIVHHTATVEMAALIAQLPAAISEAERG